MADKGEWDISKFKGNKFKPGPQQVEIARKGGKTVSAKQRRSQKLRYLKRRIREGRLKSEDEAWLWERYENNEMLAVELLSIYDLMKKHAKPGTEGYVIDRGVKLYEMIHGKKIKTENVHHVIDWSDMLKNAEIQPEEDN